MLARDLTRTLLIPFAANIRVAGAAARVALGALAVLVEPSRLLVTDADNRQPRLASLLGLLEQEVNFFEGAGAGFGIEEVDQWNKGGVAEMR